MSGENSVRGLDSGSKVGIGTGDLKFRVSSEAADHD